MARSSPRRSDARRARRRLGERALYLFLHAADNTRCVRAAARYAECLTDTQTFAPLTLEHLIATLHQHASGTWVRDVEDRYLGWSKLASA